MISRIFNRTFTPNIDYLTLKTFIYTFLHKPFFSLKITVL